MDKINLKEIVKKFGPCVSSDLTAEVKRLYPAMSHDAIKKMISRNRDIAKIPYIKFSRNRSFIYLEKDFKSQRFWTALQKAFLEEKSTYYYAISSVINNGNCVRKRDFGILCGSPLKQTNHLSYEEVLNNLVKTDLLKLLYVDEVGECVILENNLDKNKLNQLIKRKLVFEEYIVEFIKNWARNMGLVSYDIVKTKYDTNPNPTVGTFEWGMTAPSYVYPLVKYDKGNKVPGFVVCDFYLDPNKGALNDSLADIFIKKVTLTRFSMKNSRIMFMIFARKFENTALRKLKENGILAITTRNAFGNQVDYNLNKLANIIGGVLSIDENPDMLIKVLKENELLSGENGVFKGLLFELFTEKVAKIFFGKVDSIVDTNKVYSYNGEKTEVDVSFEDKDRLIFIECKNRSNLPSIEVTNWIRKRIRIVNSFLKDRKEEKKISHYLWVTGEIDAADIARLDKFKAENKKNEIVYQYGKDLLKDFSEKLEKNMMELYKVITKKSKG